MSEIMKATAEFFMLLMVLFLIGCLTFVWASTPIVIKEYPSGKCLWVDSPRKEDTCENMPVKFTLEWRIQ